MQWIVVYEYIAELYLTLGQPRAALNAAQRGIDICRQMRSMFCLIVIIYMLASTIGIG